MDISYVKMSGAGNTFIVTEASSIPAGTNLAHLAAELCTATNDHGACDGFIAVSQPISDGEDFDMLYFNRDGSTGMMCGNGGRCAVQFAMDRHLVNSSNDIVFRTAGVEYRAEKTPRGIKIYFPEPRKFRLNFKLNIMGDMRTCHYADVGTQHAIMFVDELGDPRVTNVDQLDINQWGSAVRNHVDFQPLGANANFVQVLGDGSGIRLRTFERGVEAETLACGTGAIASAIVSHFRRKVPTPVAVHVQSGKVLYVDFTIEDQHVKNVSLEGDAEYIND